VSAPPLRRHQRLALDALDRHWAEGHTRAWVELPPGAGKTRVALESGRALLEAGTVERVVALGPNTAIQGQWLAQATAHGYDAGRGRDLAAELTALTYQSLAVFDPDAEVDEEGEPTSVLSRLHDNGRALVAALADAGDILLVLDECHHLVEVWGRLLGEVLEAVPRARVLGLTATPPESLTRAQALLVDDLFGAVVHATSIPAVVREGDLAPFAELAWLVTPTAAEREWLDAGAERFAELTTQLLDPSYGEVGFLSWLDARFAAAEVP
jgi:superfamily II DNA or RNA helicase